MSRLPLPLVMLCWLPASAQAQFAQFEDLSDFDPFNRNSGIRQMGRDLDAARLSIMPRARRDSGSTLPVLTDPAGAPPGRNPGPRPNDRQPSSPQPPPSSQPTKRFAGTNIILQNATPAELLFTLQFELPNGQAKVFRKREILRPNEQGVWTVPPPDYVAYIPTPQGSLYRILVESIDPVTGHRHLWGPEPFRPGLPAQLTSHAEPQGNVIYQYVNLHIGVR